MVIPRLLEDVMMEAPHDVVMIATASLWMRLPKTNPYCLYQGVSPGSSCWMKRETSVVCKE